MQAQAVFYALLATLGTWFITMLGAGLVFFFKTIRPKVLTLMLGFASGVMIAASFWSLLDPALALAEGRTLPPYVIVGLGFLAGGGFLWLADKLLPHLHFGAGEHPEGLSSRLRRSILLVLSITLHNFPEGLAVGVAFGALAGGANGGLAAAIAVAVGIGLQNFPEGAAVSIPLRREGLSRTKSFLLGQASGLVEPVAGVLGALLVTTSQAILPYALAFSAGAMIYVVAEELLPEARSEGHDSAHFATWGVMLGFTVMMVLDTALA